MLRNVLVTGANGYLGNAVAKAFARAGWNTYGLVRRAESAADLARHEVTPILGSPADLSFVDGLSGIHFDVIVSNTEDPNDASGHLRDVRQMVETLSARTPVNGTKPLLMFSSGCKDYGWMDHKHGDPELAPQTEESPLRPLDILQPRCDFGAALLELDDTSSYQATVLRPTIIYGLSSSHYGKLFELAEDSKETLAIIADPAAIMHSCHVDDCAEAYVALAEHPDRRQVAGEAFNVSNPSYETALEVGEALASSYGVALRFESPTGSVPLDSAHFLANSWQWVDSSKLRALTGWKERRQPFAKGLSSYRMAFEATRTG